MAIKVTPLTALEMAGNGFSHKVVIPVADIAASATTTTGDINLLTLAAGQAVDRVGYYLRTDLTATSLTNVTLSIGDNGTTNVWFSTADICQTSKVPYGLAVTAKTFTTTSTVAARLISTGANLADVTAGQIEVYLRVLDLTTL